mgnify:CR=1 FL=1
MYIQQKRMIYIYELKKLIRKIAQIFISSDNVFRILSNFNLDKIDLMIVDSALKGMQLDRLDKTLLIIPDKYDEILGKLIIVFINMLQNKTIYITKIQ